MYRVRQHPIHYARPNPLHNGKPSSAFLLYHIFLLFSRGELISFTHFYLWFSEERIGAGVVCHYAVSAYKRFPNGLVRFFVIIFQRKGGFTQNSLPRCNLMLLHIYLCARLVLAGICYRKFHMLFLVCGIVGESSPTIYVCQGNTEPY